MALKTIDDMYS